MKLAKSGGDPKAAELVACEAVVLAEVKDHLDWELLSKCAEHLTGTKADTLKSACETVEDQEDEHLYHTKGWCRESWLESLVLPAPSECRFPSSPPCKGPSLAREAAAVRTGYGEALL